MKNLYWKMIVNLEDKIEGAMLKTILSYPMDNKIREHIRQEIRVTYYNQVVSPINMPTKWLIKDTIK